MTNESLENALPKSPQPYWRESLTRSAYPPLEQDITTDIVIVGGGIAGITTAYLLSREGRQVVLLEADELLNGTTGHTTAKITAQHSLIYDELIQHMGTCKAKRYFESNQNAIDFVKSTSEQLGIDCDFEIQDAYVYAVTEQYARKLDKEYDAYQRLQIDGQLSSSIPFDIDVKSVLSMNRQAQFHPLKFLSGLVDKFTAQKGQIYGHTVAVGVQEGAKPAVVTRNGQTVTANTIISCSHFPFFDGRGFYFTRMYAERAYVIAGKMSAKYPGGMYISADSPTRSIRSVNVNGEEMVLVSGESHKSGQGNDTMTHYQALAKFGQDVLKMQSIAYRWSAQDLYTLDKVPYIGHLTSSKENILVATGFKKWGMSSGIVAAQLLCDLVMERDNPYQELYSPSRFYADPSLKTFLVQNADVAGHLIAGKLQHPAAAADDFAPGEGGIVTYNGARAGAYRDDDGQLYVVDTTCTHLGCEVSWNHGDKTWDCPCHGSRFNYQGEVVEGPADKPLKRLDQQNENENKDQDENGTRD